MISNKSKLKDKLGKKVASPIFTWHSNPRSKELSGGYALTEDGFVAENLTIIKDGVLESFLLSQYGANKTGLNRAGNSGNVTVVESGESSLEDIIKSVDRGIMLCRFSGGRPGADGDFSGVAKNSFYIENGKIQYPVTETMVSGNIFSIMEDIKAISKKRVNFGDRILPWIHTTGVTISGK